MRRTHILACLALTLGMPAARWASAVQIDFETNPAAASPNDNDPLNAPYNIAGGGTVTFFFDNNNDNNLDASDSDAIFEAAGADGTDAFSNAVTGISDTASTPALAIQLGSFFLRAPTPGPPPKPLIVDYNTTQTITALSGEIWDIDGQPQGTELWRVDMLDTANLVVATQFSPLGDNSSLDGRPWVFSFSGLPAGVDKMRLTFVGTKINGIGLAFNNFDPTTAVPEPGTFALLAIAALPLAVIAVRSRRRRSKRG